ncbi:glycerol-3-phosphate responsive antiterminator [Paenibacillus lemnae]|uniref:Glycerol uptake operon antiterminator regulatory protein n=1 Tax=Paenibacillus lemnae TaxID=1330551 RepID=A0A848M753_PAELE|nr:glycerol-3-phosphate responsive antiterminator [Paenibacillus lemnae]NMO96525.1 glycerol-3-phosphate responsive antiterminator [Paenibacillus lemnae]
MSFQGQKILPAAKQMKQLEKILESKYQYGVLLDTHIARLRQMYQLIRQSETSMFLHADLIQGLKNDEYAAEYLCQEIRPDGLISTRSSVILKAKQKGIVAIQRVFLLDTLALEKNYALLEKTRPDYIEVLPGAMPHMIDEVYHRTGIPIFAGGLIRTPQQVEEAIAAGALAVTTSSRELFDYYQPD